MRAIYCTTCGRITATPPDDAARKLFRRYRRGDAAYDMSCDLCGAFLAEGDPCVAITCPEDLMPGWEEGYLKPQNNKRR